MWDSWSIVAALALFLTGWMIALYLKLDAAKDKARFWQHHWECFSKRSEEAYSTLNQVVGRKDAELIALRKKLEQEKDDKIRLRNALDRVDRVNETLVSGYTRQQKKVEQLAEALEIAHHAVIARTAAPLKPEKTPRSPKPSITGMG